MIFNKKKYIALDLVYSTNRQTIRTQTVNSFSNKLFENSCEETVSYFSKLFVTGRIICRYIFDKTLTLTLTQFGIGATIIIILNFVDDAGGSV